MTPADTMADEGLVHSGQEASIPVADVAAVAPRRVQLRRTKGWRLPLNTISVARPGKWGNPFRIGDFGIPTANDAVVRFREWLDQRVVGPPQPDPSLLRGKNLACWCRLDAPCHADVLLEMANRSAREDGYEAAGEVNQIKAQEGAG